MILESTETANNTTSERLELRADDKSTRFISNLYLGEWVLQAACKGVDVDIFFPKNTGNKLIDDANEAEAKQICASCDVREDCLEYAIGNREDLSGGIFGGLTYKEIGQLIKSYRS